MGEAGRHLLQGEWEVKGNDGSHYLSFRTADDYDDITMRLALEARPRTEGRYINQDGAVYQVLQLNARRGQRDDVAVVLSASSADLKGCRVGQSRQISCDVAFLLPRVSWPQTMIGIVVGKGKDARTYDVQVGNVALSATRTA